MRRRAFVSFGLVATHMLLLQNAFALTVCSNATTPSAGTQVPVGGYIKYVFTPRCSINTYVEGVDQTSYYAVGAASSRGKTSYKGSSAGGGIAQHTVCTTPGACNLGDAQSAASAAPSS